MLEHADTVGAVSERYGLPLDAVHPLGGGIESIVLRATGAAGDIVIRVSPRWRSLDELVWAYELVSYAATRIREANRSFIIPFIRDDIRTEIREATALVEAGLESDGAAYIERSYAAFANLVDVRL